MSKRTPIETANAKAAYLKALDENEGEVEKARKSLGWKDTDDIRQWRHRDKVFEAQEQAIAEKYGVHIGENKTRSTKRKRKAAPPAKVVDVSVITPTTEVVTDNPFSREAYYKRVAEWQHTLTQQLLDEGAYKPTDEAQIRIVAREITTLELYEELRFADGYEFMCFVHTTALKELNPLENNIWSAWKITTRHLQAMGINHDARDYKGKKKKSILEGFNK